MQSNAFTNNEVLQYNEHPALYVQDVVGPLPVGAVIPAGTVLGNVTSASGTPNSEVRALTMSGSPTGGTFAISWQGVNSYAYQSLPYNATAAQVQAALLAIFPAGTITVTGSGPWTVTFGGILQNRRIGGTFLVNNSGLTGGSTPGAAWSITTRGTCGTAQLDVYNSGNSDGTQVATCILKRDWNGTASGTTLNEWGDNGTPSSPVVWVKGAFRIGGGTSTGLGGAALIGMDSTALSTINGRFYLGTSFSDPNAVVVF